MSDQFPDEIDEPLWEEACRRADAIRGFLRRHTHCTAAGAVAELAAELGLSQATAYRLIKLFRSGGTGSGGAKLVHGSGGIVPLRAA